jgi:hypothetical protein
MTYITVNFISCSINVFLLITLRSILKAYTKTLFVHLLTYRYHFSRILFEKLILRLAS